MKISIHRALAELKLIDSKVAKLVKEIEPLGVKQKGKLINRIYDEETFSQNAQSKFQSINDLITQKVKIKSAIVEANAKTIVKIAGKEMSIADAITYKSVMSYKKTLTEDLKTKYARVKADMESKNLLVEQNLQKVLEATFGKDNVKINKEDLESVRKPFLESNEWLLIDPLKIENTIEKLEKEISEFESEVDAVLSEANAITLIEI
ncbi:MAG: hypothetical protein MUE81_12275 [Thermoflexibacter sp.]|jgi:hypothetical protein|nr:hypothetical protein [Thermoflexibacter sp.]